MTNSFKESLSQLAFADQCKYVTLEPIYGDKTFKIVKGLTDRGNNSYTSLMDRLELFEKGLSPEVKEYYNALYAEIELDAETSTIEIIQKVSKVRRALDLPSFKSKLQLKCEAEFFRLFAYEEISNEDTGDSKILNEQAGRYIPFARIMPDPKKV
jgi:hypothetical protein